MSTPAPDATLASRSPTGWRRWLKQLGHHEPTRVAESGAIVIGGFAMAALLIYAFGWLAYEVLEQDTMSLDMSALHWLQQFSSPQMTFAANAISLMGSQAVVVVCLALLTLFVVQGRWGAVVTLVLVGGGAQVLNDILKELFHRARPTTVAGFIQAQQFSFPSGHAMVSAAFYLYLAYLTWNLVHTRWRVVLGAALVLLVLLIGVARLYLEAHYLSDVVAGYMAGILWTDSVILAARVLSARRIRRHQMHEPIRAT